MVEINANLSNAKPMDDFPVLPPGDYKARVVDSMVTRSKEKSNLMARFTWRVEEGPAAGRLIFDTVMLGGSDKAVEVGQSRLKTMAQAVGHPNPNYIRDTEEFHGKVCILKVSVQKDEKYGEQNRIQNYKPISGGAAPAVMSQAQPKPAQAPVYPSAPAAPQQPAAYQPPPFQQPAPPQGGVNPWERPVSV
jgi:hypothetical protein